MNVIDEHKKKLQKAMQQTQNLMRAIANTRKHTVDAAYTSMESNIKDYVLNNWGVVLDWVKKFGIWREDMSRIPEEYEFFDIVQDIENKCTKGAGWLVVIDGQDYLTTRVFPTHGAGSKNNNFVSAIYIYQTDTLPEFLKRGVGLLKLIDPLAYLSDTGMRVDANTFFVIDEENKP